MSLTPKQQKILSFIESFSRDKGYAPSQVEIAKRFKLKSLGSIQSYLKTLEAKGYLARRKNLSRAVQVTAVNANAVRIPLSGIVAAGSPLEAIDQKETVDVPQSLLRGGENFALKVKGDSMIDEGIHDGDLVVIRRQEEGRNGQIVVALIDNEATVKIFHKGAAGIELRPANAAMKPIPVPPDRDFRILGVVVGLIRKYEK